MELSGQSSVKRPVSSHQCLKIVCLGLISYTAIVLAACSSSVPATTPAQPGNSSTAAESPAAINTVRVIHVFVALCDNVNQGIVPVSATLGNGENPATNLYWGAAFGVKTYFYRSKEWELVWQSKPQTEVLERLVFKHRNSDVYMIADAYRGKEIKKTTVDFLESAAGRAGETLNVTTRQGDINLHTHGSADLVAYIGHNGLMDFDLQITPIGRDARQRRAIILACASKQYFDKPLIPTGATPLLWTTNLMAPEAYVLSAAIDGWANKESDEAVRARAAAAYHKYQNCGLKAANRLFATGW